MIHEGGQVGSSTLTQTRTVLVVLYDPETGRAVAAHTFVGVDDELSAPDGGEAREAHAREAARRHHRVDQLHYVEAAPDLHVPPGHVLHVVDGTVTTREARRR
jgi:hypothetical protein